MKRFASLMLAALILAGCTAGQVNVNRQTVTYSDKVLIGLADAYVGIDLAYQQSVKTDTAKLAQYRKVERPKIMLAFAEARAAVAAWRAAAEAFANGTATGNDVDARAAEVSKLLAAIQQAIMSIGGK